MVKYINFAFHRVFQSDIATLCFGKTEWLNMQQIYGQIQEVIIMIPLYNSHRYDAALGVIY